MEGTQKYCQAVGVSVEDVSFFILSEIVQSTSMGEIERDGFIEGWAQLKYDKFQAIFARVDMLIPSQRTDD